VISRYCPACQAPKEPSFIVCRACALEVPAKLKIAWWGARGIAHALRANQYPPAAIVAADANEEHAYKAVISYLKQHGTALAA